MTTESQAASIHQVATPSQRLTAFYLKYRRAIEWSYFPVMWSVGALISATSVWMEYQRRGEPLPLWEPLTWEYSSLVVGLLCVWLVVRFDRRFSLLDPKIGAHTLAHLAFTLVYTAIHVPGMVMIRHAVYGLAGRTYDFGDWGFELLYEYRKDFATYFGVLVTLYVYRFLSSRLIGEASPIQDGEATDADPRTERLLIKKLGKEFLLRAEQIEWVEAAGNYMNLHAAGAVYPLRETLTGLLSRLDPDRFVRVHRSYIVNIDQIAEILPQDNGDGLIRMQDGAELRLSRRYREALRRLAPS